MDHSITPAKSTAIKISVVIPVRNEAHSIGDLLESLLNQTLKPAEIVITDGGSTDATAEIISEYAKRGTPVRLFREERFIAGRGRNLAAAQAANEWLAFIDAGITPEAKLVGVDGSAGQCA